MIYSLRQNVVRRKTWTTISTNFLSIMDKYNTTNAKLMLCCNMCKHNNMTHTEHPHHLNYSSVTALLQDSLITATLSTKNAVSSKS
jgi:hypothetical protein